MKRFVSIILFLATIFSSQLAHVKQVPPPLFTNNAQNFYSNILKAYKKENWREVLFNAKHLFEKFPDSPFAAEASYYQGVAFYAVHDYDFANKAFSLYLKNETTPKFFDEAIQFKYQIAVKFQNGHKRHLMGTVKLPKWLPAKEEALDIYNEIIATLPRHDLTARSLYQKGELLTMLQDYKASIDCFNTLIRRFPKHEKTPEAYLGIADVYFKQCQTEFPDPDILELVKVNLEKFKQNFPSEPRIQLAEKNLLKMQEYFAKDVYKMGNFYERTKKFGAAEIYFSAVIDKYPETKYAEKAGKHLISVRKKIEKTKKK